MATELENFYRDNRIREADSVNNIYNDPRYASTIFNSSVPLPQLEKNIQQSQGYMLEPAYNPTFRDKSSDYITSALEYLESKGIMDKSVREGKATSRDISKSFTGTKDSMGLVDATPIGSLFAAQEGQRKIMEAEPDALKRQMGLLSFMNKPFQTYLDRPELAEGAFDVATGATEAFGFGYLARPLYKKIEPFAKSLAKKLKGETSIVPTKEEVGALPSNKVLANTKRMPPSMAMTDPKVVDEFGFYSEAERQAKMMQQNKGSGAQFQGMLLNKGVKLDEIKALGLDDLFKNEKVTKKEIVDTIDLNKFQLIETARTRSNPRRGDPYYDPDIEDEVVEYEMETFTDIRGKDGTPFKTADEVRDAMNSGNYSREPVRYKIMDPDYDEFGVDDGNIQFDASIDTHLPTGYKIASLKGLSGQELYDEAEDMFLTFAKDADPSDWRNSLEAKNYVNEFYDSADELTDRDFVTIIDNSASSFDEAVVRLRANAEAAGDVPTLGAVTKFESNTQKGGENYKEFILSLPPFDKTKGYQDKVDINFPRHFPEYNPVFHIRTKDRTTSDGKKVLYVEELQSDFGQQGRDKGFRLKGDDLEKAKAKLSVAEDDLMKLKDFEVKLTPSEAEELFALKNPTKSEIENPLRPSRINPIYNSYATIEEVAKLRQYRNYKVLHKLGDLTDEFFNQLDLSQMGRTQDEIKSEIIKMFGSGRLDMMSPLNRRNAPNEVASIVDNEKVNKAQEIIKKYYKATTQAKGEDAPIPDAPFVKDTEKWTGLAIKRLLQMAEKGEYDHIAFSPGSVQFDRWGDEGLIKYYDEIIPSVARDTTKKMKDKSANMNTTGYVNIPIPSGKTLSIAQDYLRDGKFYIYDETGNTDIADNKLFDTKEEAREFIKKTLDMTEKGQETFAINITPKMRETVRGGMPLFSTVGGMLGVGATMSNQDIGGLGTLPNDQT